MTIFIYHGIHKVIQRRSHHSHGICKVILLYFWYFLCSLGRFNIQLSGNKVFKGHGVQVLINVCHWNIWSCDRHQFLEVYLSINMRVNDRHTPHSRREVTCDVCVRECIEAWPSQWWKCDACSHDAHLTLSHHPKLSWCPTRSFKRSLQII